MQAFLARTSQRIGMMQFLRSRPAPVKAVDR